MYPFTRTFSLLLKHTKIPKHLQFQKEEVLFSCLKHIDQLEDVMMLHPAAREREREKVSSTLSMEAAQNVKRNQDYLQK